jgi:transposase
MEKQDFRSVSTEVRAAICTRGIALIKSGRRKMEVANLFGVNKNTITNWLKSYSADGKKGLQDKKRGRRSAGCKLLSDSQDVMVQKIITDKYPEQYKLPYALWTRKAVKELIKNELGVDIARTTMGDYLRRGVKQGLSDKPAPKNAEELRQNVENHMSMQQQSPERITKYFRHKDIQYAA